MKKSRALIILTLFILSGVITPAQRKGAMPVSPSASLVGDRLPSSEKSIPATTQPRSAGGPDSLISPGIYPMTVLGGWPLADMSGLSIQLIAPSTDNDNSTLFPIGFTFRFDNVNYTTFGVNGNGLITLGGAISGAAEANDIRLFSISPKIAPYWDNLCVGSNGKVHYKTIGAAGNRKLIVEWQNMQITRNGACSGPGGGTFQLWLLETTGVIQFVYGSGMTASAAADGGYSVGLQSGGAGNFASVTTAANTVTYVSPSNDTQTSAILAGTSYAFVPNVPPSASGGSVTALTQTSLQLNWTDNAGTETTYQVSRSTDNVNFTVVATPPVNSVGFADSGLSPGTQYFYKVNALSEGAFSPDLNLSATTVAAGIISSTAAGGLWSLPATWAGGVVPNTGDDVTILDGATVTIDTAAVALNLTVGSTGARAESDELSAEAVPATLTFEETAAHSLTVGQNVLIKSNGIFATPGLGNVTGHVLSVEGNLINNGALDFSTNNNTAGANITFTGASNNIFSGVGPVTDVRTITINKGTSFLTNLDLSPANFTVQGSATDGPGSGFLTLTNGTLRIGGTFSGTHRTFPSASYSIPATAGIWLSNPNYTVAAQTGSPTVNGLFHVTSGIYNVGTAAGNSLNFGLLGGFALIEGGTVNVTGRFGVPFSASPISYGQIGGTLTVCMAPGNSSILTACFDTGTSALSQVGIAGGDIVIQNRNTSASGPRDYRHQAGTNGASTVIGGTLTFGNTATAGVSAFTASGVMPNVVIDNTAGGHTLNLTTPSAVENTTRNVTVNSGTTFNIGNFNYLMNGSSFVNNGTLTATGAASNFVWFDPAGNPDYSGTGVSSGIMTGFSVQGQSVTLSSTNNIRVRNINLFSGNIVNANKLTLGNNDNTVCTVQFGNDASPTAAGTFDTAPVFNLGTGGQTLRYLRTGNIRTIGPELNPDRILVSLTYDNDDPATGELNIAGGNLTVRGEMFLRNGEIKTGANTLYHNGILTRTSGYVNGNLGRVLIVSGSYTFSVGVNGYSPMTYEGGAATYPAIIKVKAVDAVMPGLDPAVSASRFWEVEGSGSFLGRLTFKYTDADINGNENGYGAWVSRGGGAPFLEFQSNNPASNTVSGSQNMTDITGNWAPSCCSVPKTIAGTIRNAGGGPIRNAIVTLSGGGLPQPLVFQTGNLGQFGFSNILNGNLYTLSVSAKRYRFNVSNRSFVLYADDFAQDFTASPQFEGKPAPNK